MSLKSHVPRSVTAHLRDRIISWLTENPGEHRARDVAQALGVPGGVKPADWSAHVANSLSTMVRRGVPGVVRNDRQLEGWKRPVGMYAMTPADTAPATDENESAPA